MDKLKSQLLGLGNNFKNWAGQFNHPMVKNIKGELTEVWQFSKETLVPALLNFAYLLINKIDPPLTTILTKVATNQAVGGVWQKLQDSSLWKKAMVALAPVGRSLVTTLQPVLSSEPIKPILAKPLGSLVLVIGLSILISWRPMPTPSVPLEIGDVPVAPEQVLVSSIQAEVIDISKSYGEALIDSVQTNFRLGRLNVQLSDAWYQLSSDRQEQLVRDLQKRSQTLSFQKLLLFDPQQHLLARTSTINEGNTPTMIILRR